MFSIDFDLNSSYPFLLLLAGETHTEFAVEGVRLEHKLRIRSIWRDGGEAHDHEHNGQGKVQKSFDGQQPTDHVAHVALAHEQITDVLREQ